MMRGVVLVVVAAALVVTPQAHADDTRVDTRLFSAAPDSPVAMVGTRDQLRAKAALVLPLVGGPFEPGFTLRLPAFVELHNAFGSSIPSELWRGRISLDATWGVADIAGPGSFYRWGLALEHESDHISLGGTGGFLKLNGAALRNELVLALGRGFTFLGALTARLHLFSCTVDAALCARDGGGAFASRAFEVNTDATVAKGLGRGFYAFSSIHGARMFQHAYVVAERRVVLDLGAALATGTRGTFQLYGTAFAGTDVGFLRGRGERFELGAGIRWSPATSW